MPVVPFSSPSQRATPSAIEPPQEDFALMAAAQMHTEDRLITPYEERAQTAESDFDTMSQDAKDLDWGDDGFPFPYKKDADNDKWVDHFGPEKAIKNIDSEIKRLGARKAKGGEVNDSAVESMEQLKQKILSRQGS